jgi:hypothetical protein
VLEDGVAEGVGLHQAQPGRESAIGRYEQVIDDGLRFLKDGRRTTEIGVAVHVLNRMLELGSPISVRTK